MAPNVLRNIPSVNELLESPPLRGLVERVNRNVVVSGVRSFLDNLRGDLQSVTDFRVPTPTELAETIASWILAGEEPPLRPVINATGVLLHTGLGRAPLAEEAVAAMVEVSRGYASVELDLKSGERSQRIVAVEKLLCQVTGAEAAVVVNNNAGATLLALTALGLGREIIVSRGQLIEIGGSYRLPDIMTASGARLREVGTTNKTRIADFANAIGEQTAAMMRVHTSNYVVCGFTEQPTLEELVVLGRDKNLPVIDDIGSGALIDFAEFGLKGEPIASQSVATGADLVLFSGDKLLGGPQCGVVVGKRRWVDRLSKHPLTRALRVDKVTLAGLAATLRLYQDPAKAREAVPLLALLGTSMENLHLRAERIAQKLAVVPGVRSAAVQEGTTFLGGGSIPTQQIGTWCVAIEPQSASVDLFANSLRAGMPAVVGRIQQGKLLLDLRSVLPRQDIELSDAVETVTRNL
ncbi:MAG: L-seryl-tRNA(Sec) selenium transferase [Planctomycetes bacterium]|nr:L-seryl-tRNA(Sec) selenium transferase [Planctomycetota bacterium]